MRTFIYFVILMVCAVLLGSCSHMAQRHIDESIETDSIEQEYYHVPTVHDVLEQREELKYALSISEIVEDYIGNKQFYHDTILKSMNIQKQYIPDSLPKNSKPDKLLNNNDTINKITNQ